MSCKFDVSFQARSKWNPERAWKMSSKLHDICQCRMYSGKLLMMGRGTARGILNVFGSCHQNCMIYVSAECTVENS